MPLLDLVDYRAAPIPLTHKAQQAAKADGQEVLRRRRYRQHRDRQRTCTTRRRTRRQTRRSWGGSPRELSSRPPISPLRRSRQTRAPERERVRRRRPRRMRRPTSRSRCSCPRKHAPAHRRRDQAFFLRESRHRAGRGYHDSRSRPDGNHLFLLNRPRAPPL